MRDLPIKQAVMDRAATLAERASDSRAKVSQHVEPRAEMPAPVISDGTAKIRLYDYIEHEGGFWGISASEFADVIDSLEDDVTEIELRINSGGGSVWDGLAILNTLRASGRKVKAFVDGVAASAASFIAVACDEVVMMPNSKMMIHDAMGICMGQAQDMHDYADFLDSSSDGIAEIYATKAGGTTKKWRDQMQAKGLVGVWYSAQEAVAAGLADRVGTERASGDDDPADRSPKAAATEQQETPSLKFTGDDDPANRYMSRHIAARSTAA